MAIHVTCAACGAEFKVKDEHAGRKGRCPRCKGAVVVPAGEPPAPVVEAPEAPPQPDEFALADEPRKPRAIPLRTSMGPNERVAMARSAVAPATPTRTPAEILAAFRGEIEPVRPTFLYRLWILIVAAVMLGLPMVYVAIVALVVYGVCSQAVRAVAILSRVRSPVIGAMILGVPLLVGMIVIVFMLKPLFARPGRRARPKEIDPSKEPLLFAFVDGVCASVGARRPIRVDVNCDVNAAAGFEFGVLSWVRGDLILTIGLPLVAGLSLRQFAGVLAHEFGHFSQRAGMRVTMLIRAVNRWFARVVYERDAWDEALQNWSASDNAYSMIVAGLARIAIWLTRRILWVLMMAAHFVSSFLSRQMEFDADRYEARMAGSDVFEQTTRRLTELNLGQHGAFQDLASSWRERRLPDNFPKLVLANVAQVPEELRRKVLAERLEARTGWFDTHPADKDRTARARAEEAPGIFQLGGPATDLFRDFDSLALVNSLSHYRGLLGEKVTKEQLYPVADAVESYAVAQQGDDALRRFFLDAVGEYQRLPLPPELPGPATDLKDSKRSLVAARTAMQHARSAYLQAQSAWDERDTDWILADAAIAIMKGGERIRAADFRLDEGSFEAANWASTQAETACDELADASRTFEAAVTNRLVAALTLLESDAVAARVPDGAARREEARLLYPVAAHLAVRVLPELAATARAYNVLGKIFQMFQEGKNDRNRGLINAALRAGRQLQERLLALQRSIGSAVPYPFEHAQANMTLGRFALPEVPHHEALTELHATAEHALGSITELYFRILGRLAVTAEEVERVAGLLPIAVAAAAEPVPS